MSSTEGQVSVNSNLHKQDLKNLDITNLTPLSPEVISRQATINIGTIGHVAHGKSTVVKALSGVQTVRFKNELERNITIKLERIPYEKLVRITKSKHLLREFVKEVNQKYKRRPRSQYHDERRFHLPLTPNSSEHLLRAASSPSSGYDSAFDLQDVSDLESLHSMRSRNSTPQHIQPVKKPKSKAGEYVVESIVSMESHCSFPLYFVKWKDYPPSTNTWEPFENVKECEHLSAFLEGELRRYEQTIAKINETILKEIEENGEVLNAADVKIEDVDAFDVLAHQSDLVLLAHFWLSGSKSRVERGKVHERIKSATLLKPFIMQRMQQLRIIVLWEEEINKIEENAHVTVENNADLEVVEPSFNYIKRSFAGTGVQILEEPPIGCKCDEMCQPTTRCCSKMAGGKFAYDKTGRLRIQAGEAIYECNKLCSCGPDCLNRTIQRGRKNSLCIFKTSNGCGWGLKTHKPIRKGEFVCEYVGEIITTDEANERGKQYDAIGRTYLFDLDYNTAAESVYTIDAAFHGNVSHFINHSCDPNLAVFPTWINCLDINMPRLAFFAIKPIKANEELTFDYISRDHEAELKYENLSEAEKVACRCGAENCRKVLF